MNSFKPSAYWEDRLRANYDDRGVGDIGLPRAYNHYLYEVRRRVFRRLLRRLPLEPADARVLDVGSGTGAYVREWQRWGAKDVTGCDIAQTAVSRLAQQFPRARFACCDIGEPALSWSVGERYDVVSAFDVLFHIVDDDRYEQAIKNIASLITPSGWFVYSDNLVSHQARIEHFVSRGETAILGALRRNGFQIRRRVPMFVLMNDPVRSRNPFLQRWFSLIYRMAARSETWGRILGQVLYPAELTATRFVRNGPSTEILVCQKV
jgi:SAM-dependent methyltransferase